MLLMQCSETIANENQIIATTNVRSEFATLPTRVTKRCNERRLSSGDSSHL